MEVWTTHWAKCFTWIILSKMFCDIFLDDSEDLVCVFMLYSLLFAIDYVLQSCSYLMSDFWKSLWLQVIFKKMYVYFLKFGISVWHAVHMPGLCIHVLWVAAFDAMVPAYWCHFLWFHLACSSLAVVLQPHRDTVAVHQPHSLTFYSSKYTC
jgi:hypothetical protein